MEQQPNAGDQLPIRHEVPVFSGPLDQITAYFDGVFAAADARGTDVPTEEIQAVAHVLAGLLEPDSATERFAANGVIADADALRTEYRQVQQRFSTTTPQINTWIDRLERHLAAEEQDQEATAAEAPEPRRYRPRVYLADQTNRPQGLVHGHWLDAARDAGELDSMIAAVLHRTPADSTHAWTVQATRDFAGLDLHGCTDTALISRLARGVAEHGAAYAAYVGIVGTNDPEMLDKFTDLYVGSYDSPEAWACAVADDLDWHAQLDREITDPMLRRYVVIDYAKVAREGAQSWDVVTGHDGRTHVFLR
jgi:antirestriction protein